uniref:Uncharacterized protein n=1 Tax=Anguilla anguilla TaxID=7936 RepID=A0A0E9V703_ANGAN
MRFSPCISVSQD